jgi:hypothetical protein
MRAPHTDGAVVAGWVVNAVGDPTPPLKQRADTVYRHDGSIQPSANYVLVKEIMTGKRSIMSSYS